MSVKGRDQITEFENSWGYTNERQEPIIVINLDRVSDRMVAVLVLALLVIPWIRAGAILGIRDSVLGGNEAEKTK